MEQDQNPKVRTGQTILVLFLVLLIITFMAFFYYRNIVLVFIGIIIIGCKYWLDKKIDAIKKEEEYERKE